MFIKSLKSKIILAAGLCVVAASAAAADFPSRDIRLIVPWPAGGGADGISRKISQIAEKSLGQSIYVENIGGAVTATGLMQMTKARPDGHTIGVLTYDSIITLPRGKMVPGYSLEKMTPIARITKEADAIVVSKHSGFKSFDELVSAAKAKPNTVRIGVAPKGSGPYLAVRRLEKMLNVTFNVISYAGSSSAEAEALLSGELDAAISSLGDFNGIISSGDALGVVELSSEQNPSYPKVPPISTFGHDLETGSFILLAAPKNTPPAVIAKLEGAFKTAFDNPEFQTWLGTVGVTPSWVGADGVQKWIDQLQSTTFKVMDELGL
ncbi:MAG TPA: tripartite tricarboxylate transporter substrate binding protein [Denitromonas sp.]|uniref:Bug family tripartite tricarboxylate transporter substrate binding protein n=1 Tax=Denitromonas sp. TaxID=2734609 RepID=UPI001DC32B9B|nr:tripartite tricarboxylate transporter substrate binding protein [Rhodocyclaceae bacterium]MCP5221229.1 tripartite tricarboxylate transporter substrate binding protein [Zoogloeaceae bacterium]HQU88326.1 tripartite tricarboxylate transporter substrate binding protein [Denitromonas sp.]HQV14298.1 tripartite tricarboxylate transporter substrate binding protein [Denitromonas sp.]